MLFLLVPAVFAGLVAVMIATLAVAFLVRRRRVERQPEFRPVAMEVCRVQYENAKRWAVDADATEVLPRITETE